MAERKTSLRCDAWYDPSRRTLFLVAIFVTSLLASRSGGFETLGFAWDDGTVDYWINPNFPEEEVGERDHQIDLLRGAADAWTNQTRADFAFRFRGTTERAVVNLQDGRNVVFWADADGGDALAATVVGPTRAGGVAWDMVFFSQTFGNENVWVGQGEPSGVGLDLLGVATHEFGHALGLDHTNVQAATMAAVIVGRGLPLRTLEEDDRAGVESVYAPLPEAPAPVVEFSSVLPDLGPTVGGNEVVLEGNNFTFLADTQLVVGGLAVDTSRFRIETPKRLVIADMPPGVVGLVDITVVNSIGMATLAQSYSYTGPDFVRGDLNGQTGIDLSDVSFLLNFLFLGGPRPVECLDSGDTNDDGELTLGDAVFLLDFLFRGGSAIPPPHPAAGSDPTLDVLDC